VATATTGGVYTSISGLWQSQHLLISSLRHDRSYIFNGQTPRALNVEQPAVNQCKRLGDGKLCNATCCESISWCPTLADNWEVLEHHYAAKQHLVHSIWDTHKGNPEGGMLKQQPTLDITSLNRYEIWAHVDMVQSHLVTSASDITAELYDLHCSESDTKCLELVHSLLADNKYHFPGAEGVEDGVHGPNPMQRQSKADDKWPESTSLPRGRNPGVYLHPIVSSGE